MARLLLAAALIGGLISACDSSGESSDEPGPAGTLVPEVSDEQQAAVVSAACGQLREEDGSVELALSIVDFEANGAGDAAIGIFVAMQEAVAEFDVADAETPEAAQGVEIVLATGNVAASIACEDADTSSDRDTITQARSGRLVVELVLDEAGEPTAVSVSAVDLVFGDEPSTAPFAVGPVEVVPFD